jgi:transcriptional regulator of aroF, aroG, tyrA and aromatic amino acid transport
MINKEYVLQVEFADRLGLGYEIFEVFKINQVNLLGTEAKSTQDMHIKFECTKDITKQLIIQLNKLKGITSVKLKDYMPCEQREHQLKTILNCVNEGVIAVNRGGQVIHINEVACQILNTTKNAAVGSGIDQLLNGKTPLLETLKTGQKYSLKEFKMNKNGQTIHFLTSGVPVINDKQQLIGAVATIKDFKQVKEIISKVDRRTKQMTTFDDIIFLSKNMRKIIETAKVVAKSSSTILIRGESGTGKEMFARAIHMESPRYGSPFVPINCAALPETLLESELFGYEEGAFTGAMKGGKKGLFEQANGGTLFLDEIGEISPQMQVRLLRVLQESTVRRVGGAAEISVDVRIITATHQNLEEMVERGDFREDLYYRLNVIPIIIPPLRERSNDIPLIAQHLIQKICQKLGKENVLLSEECIRVLMVQPWHGNVRQLENTLERILNVINSNEIKPQHFYDWVHAKRPSQAVGKIDSSGQCITIPITEQWPTLKEIVGKVEKQVLERVLEEHPSSRKAGKILGVSNTTILNKMKAYGLDNDSIN